MKKISAMLVALVMAITMSANTFTKVTAAPQDWSGQYLVVYEKSATEAWVFNGKDEGQDYVTASIVDGKIVSDDLDQYAVTVETMNGGYSVKVGAQYMGGDASKNTIKFNAQPILNTISMDSVVYFTSNTSVLRFNPTSTPSGGKETGIRFRYYKAASFANQKGFQLYKGTVEPIVTKIDTISVTEARARIDEGKLDVCYVYGVVATAPSDPGSYKNTIFWMTDIENPTDSLEGYKIAGLNGADIPTIDDIPFGLSDTIMIFASGLKLYNGNVYETDGGYFVEMLGKSSAISANSVFQFGVGARQWGAAFDGVRYKYELILSKTGAEDYDNALHMIINTTAAKGIAGKYTVKNSQSDSSYVDGEGPVSGSIELGYVEEAGQVNNKYTVKGDFSLNDVLYHLDTTFLLSGLDFDTYEQFKLSDDVPYVPKDGDTITCTQALQYAKSLGGAADMTDFYVRGYATGFAKIEGRTQQSIYMADDASASQGTFSAYLCYTQNLDSIVKGDYVVVRNTGKDGFSYYANSNVAQMKKGDIYRLSGSNTQRPRNPQLEVRPEGAITVAEALAIGEALQAAVGQTAETQEEYIVVGYIVDVNRQMDKDTATWYMHDVQGQYGDFQAYKCEIPSLICENDLVYVKGKIAKYQKSADQANIEIARGKAGFIELSSDLKQVVAAIKQLGAKKVLMGGRLFIVKEGRIYTPMGAVIR